MALRVRLQLLARPSRLCYVARRCYSNEHTGGPGAIRQAGGAFSKKEQAQEDQYFYNLEKEKLAKLREEAAEHHEEEIDHHEDAIEELEEQIRRHKEKIRRHKAKLDKHEADSRD